jgi:aminomuconate-semialdehyde/2-hydroxymuconate-6-semialdehyde dehydrogenase
MQTRIGSLISKEHFAKVASYVELAKQEGGKILCGGAAPSNLSDRVKVQLVLVFYFR